MFPLDSIETGSLDLVKDADLPEEFSRARGNGLSQPAGVGRRLGAPLKDDRLVSPLREELTGHGAGGPATHDDNRRSLARHRWALL